jgi:hypothetical protein
METTWKAGLEDVIAARSAITAIDGAKGRLYHRGYEIGDLAAHASFEETTYLLWFGELPSPAEREPSRAGCARRVRSRRCPGAPPHAPAGRASARRAPHRGLARAPPSIPTVTPATTRRISGRPSASRPSSRGRRRLAAAPHADRSRSPATRRARTPPTSSGFSTGARPRRRSPRSSTRSSRFTRTTSSKRLDVRGARRGRHGWQTSTLPHRRDLPRSRAAPRRRERGTCSRCCSRSAIPGGPRRTSPPAWTPTRGAPAGSGRTQDADPGLRTSGVPGGRRAGAVLRHMAKTMAEATGHARLFEVAERVYAAVTSRTSLAGQRRLLLGRRLPRPRDPGRPLHLDLRGRAAWPAGARTPSSSTRTTA